MPSASAELHSAALEAIDRLRNLLIDSVAAHAGHAGTLLAATGALAGFSAQHAVWETIIRTGKGRLQRELQVMSNGKDGQRYFYGPSTFGFLVPRENGRPSLYEVLVDGAVRAGARRQEMPEVLKIVERVAHAYEAGADFGKLMAPVEHEPVVAPRHLLERLWPEAKSILASSSRLHVDRIPVENWPLLLGLVGQQLIQLMRPVIAPHLAVSIATESALAMSMVDPRTVPPLEPEPERGLEPRIVEIVVDPRGRIVTDARVNGCTIGALVDTGATSVAMSFADARKVGLEVCETDFTVQVSTASGISVAAPAYFDSIAIGNVLVRDVPALVMAPHAGEETLLGMTFLSKLKRVEMSGGKLILEE